MLSSSRFIGQMIFALKYDDTLEQIALTVKCPDKARFNSALLCTRLGLTYLTNEPRVPFMLCPTVTSHKALRGLLHAKSETNSHGAQFPPLLLILDFPFPVGTACSRRL
jgi:hypothetical protein